MNTGVTALILTLGIRRR